MKKYVLAAALVFMGASHAAHAATLNIVLGNTNVDPLAYSAGGALSPNIDLTTPAPASLVLAGNAVIANATNPPDYIQPTGSLFGGTFLALIANPGPSGSATFTLAANQNNFGFTWGTIDNFNTLILTDSRAVTYTITGTDILSHIAGSVDGTTQSDVNFNDPFARIVSAQLLTSSNSFEGANFSEANSVPLPASLPMFGAGLLALLFFAQQRRLKA